jgi:hypothetical protein
MDPDSHSAVAELNTNVKLLEQEQDEDLKWLKNVITGGIDLNDTDLKLLPENQREMLSPRNEYRSINKKTTQQGQASSPSSESTRHKSFQSRQATLTSSGFATNETIQQGQASSPSSESTCNRFRLPKSL